MANSNPSSMKIEYDNAGGALVDISQYVMTLNDIDTESVTEETHTFGDTWDEHTPVGVGRLPAIELGGLYDDTAVSGPDALFAGRVPEVTTATTRTLKITWGGTKTTAFETYLSSYKRTADRNGLTKFTVKLQPTGAVIET